MRCERRSGARAALAVLSLLATAVPALAQQATPPQPPAGGTMGRVQGEARRITIDEAVKLALEQNLDVQVERLNPELRDLAVSSARTAWTPVVSGGLTYRNQDQPPSSFLSGADQKVESDAVGPTFGWSQLLPIGTSYQVNFDSTRSKTNNRFSSFNPSLTGNLDVSIVQPLLRDFKINAQKYQLQVAQKQREISDVALQQQIATTIYRVKNAYWDYKYALASLDVARQSLDLARESLRNTRSRVEIGTLAPIDVVEAESEVAAREEAVITAEASIGRAEDSLRTLVFDPSKQDLWNTPLDPVDPVPFQVQSVDVDGAVRKALRERTDLQQTRKNIETTGLGTKYYQNQAKPALDLRVDYNSTGLAGTQLITDGQFPNPTILDTVKRSYGSLLGDLFSNSFPTWAFSVNLSYPIGKSSAEVALARTRLDERQQDLSLRSQELSIVSQVRDAARSLVANSKRVDATRAARVLAERRLDAEEKKFAAGMSTSFQVFQAQRDLAAAKNNELRAVLDYTQSQVTYDTVQVAPVSGSTGFTSSSSVGSSIGSTTSVGSTGTGVSSTSSTTGGGSQ
jgi:outer membrane protein TolC